MTDIVAACQGHDPDLHTETLADADLQITTDADHQHTVLNVREVAQDQAHEALPDHDPDHLTRHINKAQIPSSFHCVPELVAHL